MEQKYIYVVLVRAYTGIAFIARRVMGYEYSHIAVCFQKPLQDFVTFSRRHHYTPWNCGFMHETMESYVFGRHENVKLKVFTVPVSDENLSRIHEFVDEIERDGKYKFNILSMVTMPVIHGIKMKHAHNCMSFVGKILELSGAVQMDRPYYRYSIQEMDELLTKEVNDGEAGYYT